MTLGTLKAICISEKKGTVKKEVPQALLVENHGVAGDAHAGRWHRQVSLLSYEKIEAFKQRGVNVKNGAFGENLIVEGFDFRSLPVGTRFRIGDTLLEMTQIGKECHAHCTIYAATGDCIMPREGVFAVVLKGGEIHPGDTCEVIPADIYATLRDRDPNAAAVMYTVMGGSLSRGKLLAIDGIYRGGENDGILREHLSELLSHDATGVFEFHGAEVFAERVGSMPKLIVCGGGHVAGALITIAKPLGFHITVLEDRESFADRARSLGADTVICAPYAEGLATVPESGESYYVVMTRGHRYDEECLRTILTRPYAYVGMMGSRKRAALMKDSLADIGITAETLHSPIGLSIGAQTPEEIAVSIAAELIAVKRKQRSECYPDEKVLTALVSRESEVALCTIIEKRGSAPREIGTKMLVRGDGSIVGTVGGGRTEWRIIQDSMAYLNSGSNVPRRASYVMSAEDVMDGGAVCGGTVVILTERIS